MKIQLLPNVCPAIIYALFLKKGGANFALFTMAQTNFREANKEFSGESS